MEGKNESKHTPTPWRIRFFRDGDPEQGFFVEAPKTDPKAAYNIEILSEDSGHYPVEQRLADAELIVKAVNNHHEIIAALEIALEELDSCLETDEDFKNRGEVISTLKLIIANNNDLMQDKNAALLEEMKAAHTLRAEVDRLTKEKEQIIDNLEWNVSSIKSSKYSREAQIRLEIYIDLLTRIR